MTRTDDAAADTAPPEWFTTALATSAELGRVDVDGTAIAYRAWGQPGGPGIVLVHGGAAHSRWWDHIAPLMTPGRRVFALDLSGHGDSGRRQTYSLDSWAREVLAVAGAARDHRPAHRDRAQHGRVCHAPAGQPVRLPDRRGRDRRLPSP